MCFVVSTSHVFLRVRTFWTVFFSLLGSSLAACLWAVDAYSGVRWISNGLLDTSQVNNAERSLSSGPSGMSWQHLLLAGVWIESSSCSDAWAFWATLHHWYLCFLEGQSHLNITGITASVQTSKQERRRKHLKLESDCFFLAAGRLSDVRPNDKSVTLLLKGTPARSAAALLSLWSSVWSDNSILFIFTSHISSIFHLLPLHQNDNLPDLKTAFNFSHCRMN